MNERVFPVGGPACVVEGCDPDRGLHRYTTLRTESGRYSLAGRRADVGRVEVAQHHRLARGHMVMGCEFETVSVDDTGEFFEGFAVVRVVVQLVKVKWF